MAYRRWLERGASALEAIGIALLASLVIGGTVAAVRGVDVAALLSCAVARVTGAGGTCDVELPKIGVPAEDGDRRDEQRNTRDDRRNDARGDRPEPEGGTPTGGTHKGGTPGGTAPAEGLGQPVIGTDPPPMPEPPAWTPPDEGAGPHASEEGGFPDAAVDRAVEFAAEAAANALSGTWPDASRNLLHFLANSGEPLEQDVDAMLGASEKLAAAAARARGRVIDLAVAQAQEADATGPMTFPVNTEWTGVYIQGSDDQNWFYALGGIAFNQTGYVTVTPPSTPGGSWTYRWSTAVNIRDRYNWDGTKSTTIGPFNVTDDQLAELHRKGLAQEYTAVGTSSPQDFSGEVP